MTKLKNKILHFDLDFILYRKGGCETSGVVFASRSRSIFPFVSAGNIS